MRYVLAERPVALKLRFVEPLVPGRLVRKGGLAFRVLLNVGWLIGGEA